MYMLLGVVTINSKVNGRLYYGKDPIGERDGKPFYCSLDTDKPVPFNTQNPSELKRLLLKAKKFESSGFNKEVKFVYVTADGKRIINDDVSDDALNNAIRRNLPKAEVQAFLRNNKKKKNVANDQEYGF